jgi:hypothetical protein
MPVAFVSLKLLRLRRLCLLLLWCKHQANLAQIRHHIAQNQRIVILQMDLGAGAQIGALCE